MRYLDPRRRVAVLTVLATLAGLAASCAQGGTDAAPTASPTASATPSAVRTASATPSAVRTTRPTPGRTPVQTARPATQPPVVPPPPRLGPGPNSVYVLGDSVLLGASRTVPAALSGWVVTFDADGSRRLPQGIEVLRARRQEIGRVVVIQLGNNYIESEGPFGAQLDEAMRVLSGVSRVVWLTVAEKWQSRVYLNNEIRAGATRWPQIVVGDWAAQVRAHPEYAGDQLHLSPEGRIAIARLIASCVGPPPSK